MRHFTIILILMLRFTASAQKQDCRPQPGSIQVCDSVYRLCRIDAYYLTMISVSKPTSQWYDSIRYPEELMFNYTNAMCALHNDLVDTLADFRTYHYAFFNSSYFHPDSTFTIEVDVPFSVRDTLTKDLTQSGNARIDSLMIAAGLTFQNRVLLASLDIRLRYKCPPMVNRALIERKLKSIHPQIIMTPVYKYCPFHHMVEADEGPDRYSITLMESYKCMPPELPCEYIRRTFYYQHEWGARYGKFERGTVPWPNPCFE